MTLERVAIQAFRSLYDIEFTPGRFTVLAGPNNAGKSTLAQALKFLAEAYVLGLEFAVNRAGGYENIAFRKVRRTKRPVAFEVDATFSLTDIPVLRRELMSLRRSEAQTFRDRHGLSPRAFDARIDVNHRFELKAQGQAIEADYAVLYETLKAFSTEPQSHQRNQLFRCDRDSDSVASFMAEVHERDSIWARATRPFDSETLFPMFTENLDPTDLLLPAVTLNPILRYFAQLLGSTQLYQLIPLECRLPGSPTPNAELGTHGGNLPALVAHMARHFPEAWENTMDAMRQILPGLTEIRTAFTPDRRLTLQFVEERGGKPWTPEEVSDGTIQSLALFLTLFDTRQQVVVIEEPENALHPWIVRSFVDACRDATQKQIILTTHSPALLGYLRPEEVTLVWRRDGQTHIKPLLEVDPSAHQLWSQGSASVFDILDGGFLKESVPEGYA